MSHPNCIIVKINSRIMTVFLGTKYGSNPKTCTFEPSKKLEVLPFSKAKLKEYKDLATTLGLSIIFTRRTNLGKV